MKRGIFIGIDGGGTHSTAVAAWPDGRTAAVAYGGGLNFHNDGVEKVRLRLEEMVEELCEKCGASAEKVCVGMSALDGPADDATLALFTSGKLSAEQLDLQSDAYVALMGLTRGEPGMIVICGTGSMLLLLDEENHQLVSGGWGYLLGDAGSGYTLAREGLLAVIDEADGVGSATPLTAKALEYFGVTHARALIDVVYAPDCTPDRIAGFARYVVALAEEGETVAGEILARNMRKLAAQAAQLFKKAPSTCLAGLYGGIFAHSAMARSVFGSALMERMPQAQICLPDYQPELGAIIHLMRREGSLCKESLALLKNTYEEIRR
ncbi:MAG: hypothetical protein E7335_10025 [Clostridiales bacterium]|nr:hypothetical protein [Clostridiales bacterium]